MRTYFIIAALPLAFVTETVFFLEYPDWKLLKESGRSRYYYVRVTLLYMSFLFEFGNLTV